jgi:hypothetical protein
MKIRRIHEKFSIRTDETIGRYIKESRIYTKKARSVILLESI